MSVGEEVRMNPPPHKRWRPSEELEELEKNLKTKEISAEEFDTFLALLLNLGIAPQLTLRHYWKAPSADTSTGSLFFSSHVSKEVDADLAMFGLHPEDSCQIDQTQDSKPLEPLL